MRTQEGHQIKYQAIYMDLKKSIEAGHYLQGSFLPTEIQMMEEYGVSRTTIRKAMGLLRQDKLVKINQGRGAEVLKGKKNFRQTDFHIAHNVIGVSGLYLKEGKSSSSSSIIDVVRAEQRIEAGLSVEPMTEVYRIQRLKFCGEIPFDFVASYVPCRLAPGLEKFSGQVFWLNKCLHDEYGISSTKVTERISAGAATFLEANMLHISVGAPLLVVIRTAWLGDEVMEYTESRIRPDVFQIGMSMSEKPDYLETEDEKAMEIVTLL